MIHSENFPKYPLRSSYGTVILPEGTILYHTGPNRKFKISNVQAVLFMTHHPSEWVNKYITTIELQREVNLNTFGSLSTFLYTEVGIPS